MRARLAGGEEKARPVILAVEQMLVEREQLDADGVEDDSPSRGFSASGR